MNKLQNLIQEIKQLEDQLLEEIQRKQDAFVYKIKGKKVTFEEATRKYHKGMATGLVAYIFHASFLNILTAPFIWLCIVPAVLMDAVVSLYQFVCFRVYGIPKVKRSDYIVVDRHNLSYLNLIEKMNCMFCGYFNGLIAYVQEIGARTEQHWCPIKHARKVSYIHTRYHRFFEYGDARSYRDELKKLKKDYSDLQD
ncbi:MAG TPA: hypothetical protein VIQ81_09250 [Gammaproteobacteria bacterium]